MLQQQRPMMGAQNTRFRLRSSAQIYTHTQKSPKTKQDQIDTKQPYTPICRPITPTPRVFNTSTGKRHTSSYYSSKHRYSSYMCFPSVSCLFGDDSNTDCSHGGLASQDDIRQQPHGLSTVLQEMGLIVSTGETGHVVFEYRFLRQRRSHRRLILTWNCHAQEDGTFSLQNN